MQLYETGFLIAPNMTEEEAEGIVPRWPTSSPRRAGR